MIWFQYIFFFFFSFTLFCAYLNDRQVTRRFARIFFKQIKYKRKLLSFRINERESAIKSTEIQFVSTLIRFLFYCIDLLATAKRSLIWVMGIFCFVFFFLSLVLLSVSCQEKKKKCIKINFSFVWIFFSLSLFLSLRAFIYFRVL